MEAFFHPTHDPHAHDPHAHDPHARDPHARDPHARDPHTRDPHRTQSSHHTRDPRIREPRAREPHRTHGAHPTHEPHPTHDAHRTTDARTAFEYRAELTTCELIAELLRLLSIERGAERLVCRYLADLAERIQRRRGLALTTGAHELRAARSCFGLGPREARERVRIGRALRQLPEIEQALVDGELSYSRVREITRVATAASELEWLELARQLDMRSLERRVARTMTAAQDLPAPEAASPKTRRVTFELSEGAWSLLERALESARRAHGAGCSDSEALEVVARVALSARGSATGQHATADASGAPTFTSTTASSSATASTSATANSSTTASPTTAAATRAAPTASRPVRPWSWDDLGCGATQSGSSDEGATQRARRDATACSRPECVDHSREHATECSYQAYAERAADHAMGWGTTQSGSSGEGHYPRARERSRQDAVERSDENAEGRSNQTDAGRSSHADTGRSSHTDTGPSSHTDTGPSSHKDLELRGRDDLRRSPVAVHSKEESTDWLDAEDQGWTDSGPDEQEQERKNARERERWGAVNSRLLQAMGGGGRWNADSLIEATGLSASEVNTALTYLQLGGRIRRRGDVFEPI